MDNSTLFGIATVAYIFAMMLYIAYMAFKAPGLGLAGTILTVFGFVCQSAGFIMRTLEFKARTEMGWLRAIPLTNLYESLVFFVWALILIYLIVEFKYQNRSFGAFVTPVAGLILAFIEMSGMSKEIQPLVPALQSNWLLVHVFMSFVAYATFALAFSTSLMYLVITTESRKEPTYVFWTAMVGLMVGVLGCVGLDFLKFRLLSGGAGVPFQSYLFAATFKSGNPAVVLMSLAGIGALVFGSWRYGLGLRKIVESFKISPELLDEITYRSISVGFPIFTLGGLIFGAIWADQAWGVYWSWDPKETWSLITWFAYAFYLHARLMRGWRGHALAVVSVVGFAVVLFTYLGVNLLLSGLHSYGAQ